MRVLRRLLQPAKMRRVRKPPRRPPKLEKKPERQKRARRKLLQRKLLRVGKRRLEKKAPLRKT